MRDLKVLIAEDETVMRQYISFLLKQFKCEVIAETASGEEAVALAKELSPDFILMDISLKGNIDGIEAARQISLSKEIPILFMSAYDYQDKIREVNIPHVLGYLCKPVDEHNLRACIKKIKQPNL